MHDILPALLVAAAWAAGTMGFVFLWAWMAHRVWPDTGLPPPPTAPAPIAPAAPAADALRLAVIQAAIAAYDADTSAAPR